MTGEDGAPLISCQLTPKLATLCPTCLRQQAHRSAVTCCSPRTFSSSTSGGTEASLGLWAGQRQKLPPTSHDRGESIYLPLTGCNRLANSPKTED